MAKETKVETNKRTFKIGEFSRLVLKKWKWVLLSMIICISAAVLYLMRTAPTYELEASVIVKDESDGLTLGGMPDIGLADIGLFGGNSNFENELSTFRSPDYMREVVERLGLQTTYLQKEGLRKNVLYGEDLPIAVDFQDLTDDESVMMKFNISKNGDITINKKMVVNGRKAKMDDDLHTRFDTTIKTPAGAVTIHKTKNWGVKKREKHNIPEEYIDENEDLKFIVLRMTINEAVETYSAATDVSKENDKGATIINLSVTSKSQQLGEDVLSTLIDVYNQRWTNEKNQLAVNTSKFIDDRLATLAVELGDVDAVITDYKKRNLILDDEATGRLILEKAAEVDKQYLEQANNLEIAKYLREFLSKEHNKYQTLPVNLGVGVVNTALEKQISDYNLMILDRNTLAANSSASNPVVQTRDENLAVMRRSILAALDNQVTTLNKTVNSIVREQGSNDHEVSAASDQAAFLRSQGREQLVKEQLYLFLLQKKEENEISKAFNGQNIKIIRQPGGSDEPYKPKPKLVMFLALFMGFAIPVGVLYYKQISDTKIRTRKDLDGLEIPILGEIPRLPKRMPKESKEPGDNIVVGEGMRDMANEAFRVVRTNLALMTSSDPGGTVIMFTSFIPNSGKTFLTLNLAVACAMKRKVLLIDCDLRKCSASAAIGKHHKGLTDYLNGKVADIDTLLVCDTLAKNLCVLPAGTIPPNPTELLEMPLFKETIEHLRKKYDYIFIDCPPSEMMADTQIINSVADRTIFVLRAGNLPLSAIPQLKQYYDEKKFHNISVILNGLDEVQSNGYGYGYGEVAEERKGWRRWFVRK